MTCNDCIHRSVCYRADDVPSDHARKCGDFDALQRQTEKICDLEKSNFDVRQYKLDTDTAYECGYNAGLQAQADGEYVRKKDVMGCIGQTSLHFELARKLRKLSPVSIPQTDCNTCDKAVRDRVGVIGCAKFDSKPTMTIPSAESYDFAKWVASEIFDDMWEYNKDAFAEIACRKLAKLGIVRAKGDEWMLIEQQEVRKNEQRKADTGM